MPLSRNRTQVRAEALSTRMATVESAQVSVRGEPTVAPQTVGRLGSWQLARMIGEGSFTRLYTARPADGPQNQAPGYVVKVLRKEWWRDPQAIEMQRREAWVGSRVSHPNLLPVLSSSVQEPPFYFVTPKLGGLPLSEWIRQQERLSIPFALWVARQVADGLAALHEMAGMIHCDVKPDNIFVSPSGHATLLDFGFAQAPSEMSHWSSRPIAGTLAYIAPEMLTSALAAAPQSDLYSLGVTMYEMLAGQRPWETNDTSELVTLHREVRPTDIRMLRPDTPEPVATLIHALLAKDPLRRPHSARELASRLVRLEIRSFAIV